MPHIALPEQLPGIRSLVAYRPETGRWLYELAEALLCSESTLSRAERELIAAFVSSRNRCVFCTESHAAASRCLFADDAQLVDQVLGDYESAPVPEKLRALLAIAAKVQIGGRIVTDADVEAARAEGATDREIHDTVLIAAAFSMYNRYVDGLATWTPTDRAVYDEMGARLAQHGYAARFTAIAAAGS